MNHSSSLADSMVRYVSGELGYSYMRDFNLCFAKALFSFFNESFSYSYLLVAAFYGFFVISTW